MSVPDFDRADYLPPVNNETPALQSQPLPASFGELPLQPLQPAFDYQTRPAGPGAVAFLKALLFGAVAAVLGSLAWGLFAQTGIIVGILAIGIGWLVARAMMTASGGVGGRSYQIAAVLLTYFSCSFGDVVAGIITEARHGAGAMTNPVSFAIGAAIYVVAGPILELKDSPINGALGLVILFFGLRTAWRLALGSPGFGGGRNAPGIGPFGPR